MLVRAKKTRQNKTLELRSILIEKALEIAGPSLRLARGAPAQAKIGNRDLAPKRGADLHRLQFAAVDAVKHLNKGRIGPEQQSVAPFGGVR